jgi:hypothetical protein
MVDSDVLGTCLSKEEANNTARDIFRQWNADKKAGDMLIAGSNEGIFLGPVCISDVVQTKLLIVNFEDGRIEKDGVISYC